MLRSIQQAEPAKTYKSYANAEKAATEVAESLAGAVTVFIHCTPDGRFYPVFCCFSEQNELVSVAYRGFIVHL